MAGQFSSEAAVKGASVGPATEICAICGSDGYAEGRHQPANGDRDQGGSVAMGLRMVALAAAAAIVVIVGWQEITADWTPWIGWLFVAQSDDGVEAGSL
jgi:hypothetical protein